MEKLTDMPATREDRPAVTEVVRQAQQELEQVQRGILEKNRELLKCDEVELPRVARELQRLRVALITLNELVTNISDPTAKQEISLLSKMLLGRQESGGGDGDELLEEEAAKSRLTSLGIDPASADNMARGLRALQAVMQSSGRLPGHVKPS